MSVPQTLEAAIAQAKAATLTALDSGLLRLQVEIVMPEIALKAQAIAQEFAMLLAEEQGAGLKVLFPDTGAAALARRDWGEIAFQVGDLGSRYTPIESKVAPEDRLFLLVNPSAVEVQKVETLCNLAGDRPVILLIPKLEDVAIVGIGYAARQLRERFLSQLESCYYLQPLEGAALYRCFPSPWQVWVEKDDHLELIAEDSKKPVGDALERILNPPGAEESSEETEASSAASGKSGWLGSIQRFLRALNN